MPEVVIAAAATKRRVAAVGMAFDAPPEPALLDSPLEMALDVPSELALDAPPELAGMELERVGSAAAFATGRS